MKIKACFEFNYLETPESFLDIQCLLDDVSEKNNCSDFFVSFYPEFYHLTVSLDFDKKEDLQLAYDALKLKYGVRK